ncbi:hypothetical protein V6N11_060418 [Hibiscus sabdariffa]|uniref:Uncharacterized protein n=1 Tax=Hibiscus sabdariffa TaxID=183260 RepID=A0ABR2QQJ0_9ROSI
MDFMNQGRNPRPAQSYGSGRYWVKGAYDHVKVKKVDFGKTGAVKRKAGIIYRNQRPLSRAIEETEENSADKTMEPEKSGGQAEKGETMVYGGSKARVKRSCKGKMKIFGQRLGHNSLPVGQKVNAAQLGPGRCKLCEKDTETLLHAMRECQQVQTVLKVNGMDEILPQGPFVTCMEWLIECWHILESTQFTFLIVLL